MPVICDMIKSFTRRQAVGQCASIMAVPLKIITWVFRCLFSQIIILITYLEISTQKRVQRAQWLVYVYLLALYPRFSHFFLTQPSRAVYNILYNFENVSIMTMCRVVVVSKKVCQFPNKLRHVHR